MIFPQVRVKFAITFTSSWGHQLDEAKNKNEQHSRANKKPPIVLYLECRPMVKGQKSHYSGQVMREMVLSNWPPNLLKDKENRQKPRYFYYHNNVRTDRGKLGRRSFQESSLTRKSQTQDAIQPGYASASSERRPACQSRVAEQRKYPRRGHPNPPWTKSVLMNTSL